MTFVQSLTPTSGRRTRHRREVWYVAAAVLTTTVGLAAAASPAGATAPAPSPRVHVEGLRVGTLDADFSVGMVRTKPGTYDVVGTVPGSGPDLHYAYFHRTANGRAFAGGAIVGSGSQFSAEELPAAEITRSADGRSVITAIQLSCTGSTGGIYVLRKPASAANFAAVAAVDRVRSDTDCANPQRLYGVAALRGGRVAVLVESDMTAQLLIGKPGGLFIDTSLHARTIDSRPQITRDPDTGEVVVALMGREVRSDGEATGPTRYLLWTRTNNRLHGPTVLPAPTRGEEDAVSSLAASDGQVWVGIRRDVSAAGAGTPPPAGLAVIHRDSKGRWGHAFTARGTSGRDNVIVGLAAVPRTGTLHVIYRNTATSRDFHIKRSPRGHWTTPAALPKNRHVLAVVSTPAGGYRYAYQH